MMMLQENLSFFLDACKKLGLKGSQLFDAEDLQGLWTLHGDIRRLVANQSKNAEKQVGSVSYPLH